MKIYTENELKKLRHDLKSNTDSIMLALQTCLDHDVDEEDKNEMLKLSVATLEKLGAIHNEILAFLKPKKDR